jgi:hypothetical protein
LIIFVYATKFFIGLRKYLFKTKENINITIIINIAVLRINVFLSSMADLTSLAFSVITRYPILTSFNVMFLTVVNKN